MPGESPISDQLVSVGTHRLRMQVEGEGLPAVVIDTGLGDELDKLARLQNRIARVTQTITYNRAGYGQSEPGPLPRDGAREAEELKRLLDGASIPGPYVLVGHSLGALNVMVFASRYPEDVAGMILLDPPPLSFALGREYVDLGAMAERMTAEWQAIADSSANSINPQERARSAFFQAIASEHREMRRTASFVEGITTFGDIPLVVIASGKPNPAFGPIAEEFQRYWVGQSRALTGKSARSRFVLAEESSHYLYLDAPELVEDNIVSTVALASTTHAAAAAQGTPMPGEIPDATVIIPLHPFFRDLRTVRAVHGADTLTFLFDTGGGATMISPSVAARIGCRPFGRQVGHRMQGDPVEYELCDSIDFTLGGWPVRYAPVGVFDVNALLPQVLPKLDGVLSLDTFRGQVITIDWPASQLLVHSANDSAPALMSHGIPARFATGDNGGTLAALVPVGGLRGPLWFLIDSGNILGTLVDAHILRDSLLVLQPDSTIVMRVGGRERERIPIALGHINLDGAFGTAYLLRGPVSLDLRKAR